MKNITLTFFFGFCMAWTYAQQTVSIGSTETKPNAVLWLNSPNKNQGLIIPVVSSRNLIASPGAEPGMIVFDDTDKTVYFYTGLAWVAAGGGTGGSVIAVDNLTLENNGGTLSVKDGGITVGKIAPSTINGQVLTTSGGAVTWTNPTSGGTVTNVTAGAPLTVTNSSTTPTISMNQANATTSGFLSTGDWNTFNNKLGSGSAAAGDLSGTFPNATVSRIRGINVSATAPTLNQILQYNGAAWTPSNFAGGTVTTVSGTSPISVTTPTSTPVISMTQANGTTNGFLSSTDWNTFNNKLSSATLTTSGDLLFHNGSLTTRLPRGTNGQVLTSSASGIQWGAITGSNLAANISVSTTGNIATTGAGTLSVAGTATFGSLSAAGTRMVVANPAGVLSTQTIPANFTTPNVIPKGSAGGLTGSQIFDDGANVGIGTTTPATALDVSAVSPSITLTSTSGVPTSAASSLEFRNAINGSIGSIGDTGSSDHLQVSSFVQGILFNTAFTNRMAIDFGGNVGIGTISPTRRLDVDSNGGSYGVSHVDGTIRTTTYNGTFSGGGVGGGIGTESPHPFHIYVANSGEKATFLPNGNVGIGTNAPTSTLEVNGFTKLGTDAPAIRIKKLTGTTAATQGGAVFLPHGLASSQKIIGIQVMVEYSPTLFIQPSYTTDPGYHYSWIIIPNTDVQIYNAPGNSGSILSKPVTVLVTYEE